MRYRIEYLWEATEEDSVCDVVLANGDLWAADSIARLGLRAQGDAGGYQIRDLWDDERIVLLEFADEPAPVLH